MQVKVSLELAARLIEHLQQHGIMPILYGSLGASMYLGSFKDFGDIDLLVDSVWLDKQWPQLIKTMRNNKFELIDLHEHEFQHRNGLRVAFAKNSILERDNIITSLDQVVTKHVGGIDIHTLSPEAFRKAYEFSRQDGYRRDVRQKNDETIIELLDAYITPR